MVGSAAAAQSSWGASLSPAKQGPTFGAACAALSCFELCLLRGICRRTCLLAAPNHCKAVRCREPAPSHIPVASNLHT